jgi:hypothetical protein
VAVEINREEFIQVLIDCCRAYNEEGGKIWVKYLFGLIQTVV